MMVTSPIMNSRTLLCLALVLSVSACKSAQTTDSEDEPEAKVTYTVNRTAWRYLDKAQRALAEDDLKEAKEALDDMKDREGRFNPYEVALMWQTYAHLYAAEENLKEAADSLEKSLIGETFPKRQFIDTLYNLASLEVALGRFDNAASRFERWLSEVGDDVTPTGRFNAGVAFAQAKRFEKAREQTKLAIDATEDPTESWLQQLLALEFELGNDLEVEKNLKRLIIRYPNKTYWQQLASVYAARKDEPRTLATLELMYIQGMLKSREDVVRLAQMLLFRGVPIKAIKVVEKSMAEKHLRRDVKTLELLANSYLYARESAEAKNVLAAAAAMSDTGEHYLQLARQHMRDGAWDEAIAAAQRGLTKGNLKNAGDAHLLLGSIYFNAERWNEALAAFNRAAGHPQLKATAERWRNATQQQIANLSATAANTAEQH